MIVDLMSTTVRGCVVINSQDITAVVLCGGQGARLHGQDKPLISVGLRRIIDYLLEQLEPQVGRVLLSCSRNVALYEAIGHEVVVDSEPARGPLAGIVEAMQSVATPWMLTVPGDVPLLPATLVNRLIVDAEKNGVAVPIVDGQRENLFLLLNLANRQDLAFFYEQGGIAVKYWLDKICAQPTDLSDIASGFLNINTPTNLAEMEQIVQSSA